jgi:hypothetical protein
MRSLRTALLCGLGVLLGLGTPAAALAQGQWGTIKGQFICTEKEALKPVALNVGAAPPACLKGKPLLSEKYVVNPKNKGVRWVVVWLARDVDGKADNTAELPIHPDLKKVPEKPVVMDQPCCRFEPHLLAFRKGQDFIGKNSADMIHNMFITSSKGPNLNKAIAVGGELKIPASEWKTIGETITVACSIHGWMKAHVFVFEHPYFAVTDEDGNFEIKNAPAGKYRLVGCHHQGWTVGEKSPSRNGKLITVPAGGTLDLGKIVIKYDPD